MLADWLPIPVGVAYRTNQLVIGSVEDGRGEGAGVIWGSGRCQALSSWIECGRGAVASPWAVWAQVGVRMPVWAASTEYLHFANSGNTAGRGGLEGNWRWGGRGGIEGVARGGDREEGCGTIANNFKEYQC